MAHHKDTRFPGGVFSGGATSQEVLTATKAAYPDAQRIAEPLILAARDDPSRYSALLFEFIMTPDDPHVVTGRVNALVSVLIHLCVIAAEQTTANGTRELHSLQPGPRCTPGQRAVVRAVSYASQDQPQAALDVLATYTRQHTPEAAVPELLGSLTKLLVSLTSGGVRIVHLPADQGGHRP